MSRIKMYCTAWCPYCIAAERLLTTRGVVEIEKIRVDLEPVRRAEMMHRSGRRSVPQIYIGDFHVGGFEELAALDHAGKLEAMLGRETAETRGHAD
jgi:glutaredoxin 3